MTFFNFKNGNIDMLRLGKGLLYGCFLFQLTFGTKKKHSWTQHWNFHCPKTPFFRWNNPYEMWRITRTLRVKSKSWGAQGKWIFVKDYINNHIHVRSISIGHHQWGITRYGWLLKKLIRNVVLLILLFTIFILGPYLTF